MKKTINIYSIFLSVSGEVGKFKQGSLTTFVRLSGCNIHCVYCDTKKALSLSSGKCLSIEKIIEKVESIGCKQILITGGEPLLQIKNLKLLIKELTKNGYFVSIETNGTILPNIPNVYCWIADYKLFSSGYSNFKLSNKKYKLFPEDSWVKFVCLDRQDYEEAKAVIKLLGNFNFALSAAIPWLAPEQLCNWMMKDKLFSTCLNVQIHKHIWQDGEKEK